MPTTTVEPALAHVFTLYGVTGEHEQVIARALVEGGERPTTKLERWRERALFARCQVKDAATFVALVEAHRNELAS